MRTLMRQIGGVLVGMLCVGPVLSQAQVATPARPGDVDYKSMKVQLVPAPNYQVSSTAGTMRGSSYNRRWLQIEVDFATKPDWVDGVTVKCYVLLKQKREIKMFVGEVTHNNVEKGLRHTSAMFVPPSILERYGDGKFEIVGVEMTYDGKTIGRESSPATREEWWSKFTPVTGAVLPPSETPWAMIAYDRYESTASYAPK